MPARLVTDIIDLKNKLSLLQYIVYQSGSFFLLCILFFNPLFFS